jgi:hypothetical protein
MHAMTDHSRTLLLLLMCGILPADRHPRMRNDRHHTEEQSAYRARCCIAAMQKIEFAKKLRDEPVGHDTRTLDWSERFCRRRLLKV